MYMQLYVSVEKSIHLKMRYIFDHVIRLRSSADKVYIMIRYEGRSSCHWWVMDTVSDVYTQCQCGITFYCPFYYNESSTDQGQYLFDLWGPIVILLITYWSDLEFFKHIIRLWRCSLKRDRTSMLVIYWPSQNASEVWPVIGRKSFTP